MVHWVRVSWLFLFLGAPPVFMSDGFLNEKSNLNFYAIIGVITEREKSKVFVSRRSQKRMFAFNIHKQKIGPISLVLLLQITLLTFSFLKKYQVARSFQILFIRNEHL